MSTSPKKPCVGERSEATTQGHERFIEHQRLVLLRYLDGTAPGSADELDALSYVETSGPHIDPYEKLLMENLVEVREFLRHQRSLPEHRFMATRPDGA